MTVIIKLAEYIVPHLNVTVTLAAYGTSGLSAAELLASVIINLRAGAAGAGTVLPEVVLFSKAENTVCRNADFLIPDLKGLVVIYLDGWVQTVRIKTYHFC